MSLSSREPGILLGWFTNGKKGQARITKYAKKFQRRLARRRQKRKE